MRRILLIEPSYKNKYPPLGLMKISTYHKLLGDEIVFCKGTNKELQNQEWDRIYITTLFTFHWNTIIKTIKFYLKNHSSSKSLYVGGPMATIMKSDIMSQKGLEEISVIEGLLDKPSMLDDNEYIIDELIPDYSIIDNETNPYLNYEYPIKDAYFIYSTKGCIRKCEFCAVPIIEPKFKSYIDIKPRLRDIRDNYGEKRNLLIMDNNIVASPKFDLIIDDIIKSGFGKDNNNFKYEINGKKRTKKRYVDFNQGLDARVLYEHPEKMELLGKVAVKPLRVAFDYADDEFIKIYTECMHMAAENDIKELSNYILFNLHDTPEELYKRLRINLELNNEFAVKGYETRIWSFPMRFSPLFGEHAKGRKYVGENWTKKQIRGVQCILNATHGVVGPKISYFNRAFGKSLEEFEELLWMPEKYILRRNENEQNGNTINWKTQLRSLSPDELLEFKNLIAKNNFKELSSNNNKINILLEHYCYNDK